MGRNEKGVTLVILVITIIILLLLASITITAAIGEDGLIKKSHGIANKMEGEAQAGQEEMNNLLEEVGNFQSKGTN